MYGQRRAPLPRLGGPGRAKPGAPAAGPQLGQDFYVRARRAGPVSKAFAICVAGGVLISAGLGASTWGSQLVFEEFEVAQASVGPGQSVTASKQMGAGQSGVYAVEVPELESVRAVLSGPGGQISEEYYGAGASEGLFEAGAEGLYVLQVYNEGGAEGFVAGYIGPEPDASKRTIAFVSIYVLVAGIGLLAGGAVYAFRRRVS